MKANKYELISHTADIGIRVKANSLEGIFCNTASAMFDIMAKEKTPAPIIHSLEVSLNANSQEELAVFWLNELLSLSQAKQVIFDEFIINKLTNTILEAVVKGKGFNNYAIDTEIKAATFHELKLNQVKNYWQLELIFDV